MTDKMQEAFLKGEADRRQESEKAAAAAAIAQGKNAALFAALRRYEALIQQAGYSLTGGGVGVEINDANGSYTTTFRWRDDKYERSNKNPTIFAWAREPEEAAAKIMYYIGRRAIHYVITPEQLEALGHLFT